MKSNIVHLPGFLLFIGRIFMIPAGSQNPLQEASFGELDKFSKKFTKCITRCWRNEEIKQYSHERRMNRNGTENINCRR